MVLHQLQQLMKGSKPEVKKITIPNTSESSKIVEFAGKKLVFLDNCYSRNIQNI